MLCLQTAISCNSKGFLSTVSSSHSCRFVLAWCFQWLDRTSRKQWRLSHVTPPVLLCPITMQSAAGQRQLGAPSRSGSGLRKIVHRVKCRLLALELSCLINPAEYRWRWYSLRGKDKIWSQDLCDD